MIVRLLGAHNSESLHTRLSSLLIDDTLVLDAGGITSCLSLDAQQKAKAVLLTHQHYDHTRDLLTLAMNLSLSASSVNVYATSQAYEALAPRLFDGKLYPDFRKYPEDNPAVVFKISEPLKEVRIQSYRVLPVPVAHSVSAVGYQVTSRDDKALFYTGDAGPGLSECWQHLSPRLRLLITELTFPNRFESYARGAGHLTPGLLKRELIELRKVLGALPQVVAVHLNPMLEEEIRAETAAVSEELHHPITLGCEGMEINL